jgi:hypothetical protein
LVDACNNVVKTRFFKTVCLKFIIEAEIGKISKAKNLFCKNAKIKHFIEKKNLSLLSRFFFKNRKT